MKIFFVVFICLVAAINAQCNPPCANGGTCVDSVCKCSDGYSGATCLERTCMHGKSDPESLKCICDAGWVGTDCLVCDDDSVCQASGQKTCSKNNLMANQKHFSCALLGPLSQYLGQNLTWSCDLKNARCDMQAWTVISGLQKEIFWCSFDSCVASQATNVTYTCQRSFCATTGFVEVSEFVKKFLAMVKGSGYISCGVDGQGCIFRHTNFPLGPLNLQCIAGECISANIENNKKLQFGNK